MPRSSGSSSLPSPLPEVPKAIGTVVVLLTLTVGAEHLTVLCMFEEIEENTQKWKISHAHGLLELILCKRQ